MKGGAYSEGESRTNIAETLPKKGDSRRPKAIQNESRVTKARCNLKEADEIRNGTNK